MAEISTSLALLLTANTFNRGLGYGADITFGPQNVISIVSVEICTFSGARLLPQGGQPVVPGVLASGVAGHARVSSGQLPRRPRE